MTSSPFMTTRSVRAFAAILLLVVCGLHPLPAAPQLTMDELTKNVWKRAFHISDAQANDPLWLAQDDDGDGISNGAELAAGTNPASRTSTLQVTNTTLTANVVHVSF